MGIADPSSAPSSPICTTMQAAKLGASSRMLAPRAPARPSPASRARRGLVTRAVAEPAPVVPFLSTADHLTAWNPKSWRDFTALQQPEYPDKVRYNPWGAAGVNSGQWPSRWRSLAPGQGRA